MDKIDKYISLQLIKFRKETELTQGEIAELLGFKSRISVVNMEQGKQSFMPSTIYLLSCIFNKQVSDFFPPVKNVSITKVKKKVTTIVIEPVFKVSKMPKIK